MSVTFHWNFQMEFWIKDISWNIFLHLDLQKGFLISFRNISRKIGDVLSFSNIQNVLNVPFWTISVDLLNDPQYQF